jgi:mono/diheme cytochrome c family protein
MTEIPEHLLKRSRDRRSALGLGGDAGGQTTETTQAGETAAAPGAATPATTAAAAPTPAAPAGPAGRRPAAAPPAAPPPKPDPPYVVAAKKRAKIPFWAMAALALLPLWLFMYVRALTRPPEVAAGPLGVGAGVYTASCASCHGGSGEGGSGRQLSGGEADATFPHIEDHIRFVYFGTEAYQLAGIDNYGDPNREGGAHTTGSFGLMPGWGAGAGGELTDAQILAAVCEERYGFDGAPETDDPEFAAEFEDWCATESPIFAALEAGTPLADLDTAGLVGADGAAIEIIDIGTAPAPGSS